MSSFEEQVQRHRRWHLACLDASSFSAQAAEKILAYGAPLGAAIEHHRQLDRCMNRLLQLMSEAEEQGGTIAAGTVVLADALGGSKGRLERCWHAPEGGVWLTVAWPDVLLPEFGRLLPFAAGLACCRAARTFGVDARLKWVNDVLVKGRKLAGILCATVARPGGERHHLLGIGLNGNNRDFPPELQSSAVSLAELLGRDVDLGELTGRLLAELSWAVGLLHYDEELALHESQGCEDGRKSLLLSAWQQLSDTVGRRVQYGFDVQKKPLYQAVAIGLDPCGGLVMELDDGSSTVEHSGEIMYVSHGLNS